MITAVLPRRDGAQALVLRASLRAADRRRQGAIGSGGSATPPAAAQSRLEKELERQHRGAFRCSITAARARRAREEARARAPTRRGGGRRPRKAGRAMSYGSCCIGTGLYLMRCTAAAAAARPRPGEHDGNGALQELLANQPTPRGLSAAPAAFLCA